MRMDSASNKKMLRTTAGAMASSRYSKHLAKFGKHIWSGCGWSRGGKTVKFMRVNESYDPVIAYVLPERLVHVLL